MYNYYSVSINAANLRLEFDGEPELDARYVDCVENLVALVSFMEHDAEQIPESLRRDFK